ncbi:MAG: hypothetical protein HY326_14280, partial [Chloroflexi bacterium]|nr:hypothetical protein [Chloroflexota bacterium]
MAVKEFTFPTTGIAVQDQALLLAIDEFLLPLKKNLCYYLTKPHIRPEPVLLPTRDPQAPDYLASHFYGTILQEDGRFRLWYNPVRLGATPTDLKEGPMAYAESPDGIHWTKPKLDQVEINGSQDNNALALEGDQISGVTLLKEEDDPDPRRRYKLIYNTRAPHGRMSIRAAISPDGIHWSPVPGFPLQSFIEQASFYKHNGHIVNPDKYAEGGTLPGRQGFAVISPDFDYWLQESADSFLLPEPRDPALRHTSGTYEQVHIGTGAASFGSVVVGLYCIWYNHPTPKDWFGFGRTAGDLGLVVSNDGLAFREPVK